MHPSREELAEYALGTLSEINARSLERHLEYCTDCERTLQELDRSRDTMIEALPVRALSTLTNKRRAARKCWK